MTTTSNKTLADELEKMNKSGLLPPCVNNAASALRQADADIAELVEMLVCLKDWAEDHALPQMEDSEGGNSFVAAAGLLIAKHMKAGT